MKTCDIEDCEKRHVARGFCSMHWKRWRKHGDPLGGGEQYAIPEEAFLARTEPIVGEPGCLVWTGAVNSKGYGQIRANGRMVLAHRFAWEREHGPIPDGMFIDHICWNRACCNTEHLRLATAAQNQANRSGATRNSGTGARGVTRRGKGYRARVKHNGATHYLGTFDTVEAASRAAETKRAILFGEYAGGA